MSAPTNVSTVAELEIAKHQRRLILKPLEAHVLGAPLSVPIPTALTSGAGALLQQLGAGWYDLGLIDKEDAITWSREMEKADINAIGYRDPVRSDITSDVFGLAFKGAETNRYNIERYLNVDLSQVTGKSVTGEIVFDQPASARVIQSRYLTIARDGAGADTIYIARALFAGEVSETQEQTITDGEGYLNWGYTVNSRVDTTAGVSVRHYFGGPGWRSLLADAGFPALTT